jgi:methylmalonyl-CoA/ethylmalonyl-CoA epimerase
MALAKKIDHVAVLVKDLAAAMQTFTKNFGFPVTARMAAPNAGIELALLRIGDADIELFTPTHADTPPAKALAERGEGMYVLSLAVDDLDAAIQTMTAKGIKCSPVSPTADGKGRLAFLSPKATHGVLLQLIEKRSAVSSER